MKSTFETKKQIIVLWGKADFKYFSVHKKASFHKKSKSCKENFSNMSNNQEALCIENGEQLTLPKFCIHPLPGCKNILACDEKSHGTHDTS